MHLLASPTTTQRKMNMITYTIILIPAVIVYWIYLSVLSHIDYLERVERLKHLPKIKEPDPFIAKIKLEQFKMDQEIDEMFFKENKKRASARIT